MPVTNQLVKLMPHGEASYRTFNADLGAIGARTGSKVLYYDTIRSDSLFMDDIHLNHAGALDFSADLGIGLKPLVGSLIRSDARP
jgi:hypothetical protein